MQVCIDTAQIQKRELENSTVMALKISVAIISATVVYWCRTNKFAKINKYHIILTIVYDKNFNIYTVKNMCELNFMLFYFAPH